MNKVHDDAARLEFRKGLPILKWAGTVLLLSAFAAYFLPAPRFGWVVLMLLGITMLLVGLSAELLQMDLAGRRFHYETRFASHRTTSIDGSFDQISSIRMFDNSVRRPSPGVVETQPAFTLVLIYKGPQSTAFDIGTYSSKAEAVREASELALRLRIPFAEAGPL